MAYEIHNNDAIRWARRYAARRKCGEDLPLFHALLCDPPYELKFMGRNWDSTGVSFRAETWRAFKRVMHSGAFGMAFASARGFHRMAVAIEDAGFVIHPMMGWVYGSGFPKATRIDTQIDKAAGAEREAIPSPYDSRKPNGSASEFSVGLNETPGAGQTAPATDLAQSWEGHRYGLQSLKPAMEPIIVFQKPYEGRPVDDITRTGAGALNIDGGRIGFSGNGDEDEMLAANERRKKSNNEKGVGKGVFLSSKKTIPVPASGRWPSNFILQHTPECVQVGTTSDNYAINRFTDGAKPFGDGAGHEFTSDEMKGKTVVWECVENCPVHAMNVQSGQLKSDKFSGHHKINSEWGYHGGKRDEVPGAMTYGDKGGAARFFHQSTWELEQTDPFFYQAKAAVAEREVGLIHYIPCGKCGDLHSTLHKKKESEARHESDSILESCRRCIHPTIKPIALAQHLASLLLPPDEYAPRSLFIPFAGTASEMIGAHRAAWDNIIGVELEPEYIDIANARMKHWIAQGHQLNLMETN